MARRRPRTVFFMEPVVLDAKQQPQPIAAGFWDAFIQHVSMLPQYERTADILGRTYEGEARSETAPPREYLYVGKRRPKADWPHAIDNAGSADPLRDVLALIEYAYLLPVEHTNYVAILRSSGGASFSALDDWLTHVCPGLPVGGSLYLRPYVRHDQLQRLKAAQGATKVHMKVEPFAATNAGGHGGEIEHALATAQNVGGGGVSVDMTLSFGNASPSEVGAEQLAREVEKLLESGASLKKLEATVLTEESGKLIRDKIDFTRDRVTVRVPVGGSENDEPTPSAALHAILEATTTFRKHL